METINAIHNQQIFLALNAAAKLIQSMEGKLAIHGKSVDLTDVPTFRGIYFPAFLMGLAENVPMETAEKDKWEIFLAENIK